MSKKNPIKVKKWISWKKAKLFPEIDPISKEHYAALVKEVTTKKIKLSGEEHQYTDKGVPLFSDNTVIKKSYRGWGRLMAEIWSIEDGVNYDYMDFYMGKGSDVCLK